ncbi:MAG: glycosyltransferase [Candidatus Wallbacteria bacterium]|nr:glycosyltransferase [Candidatus Wallbacteria bacterium]
MEPPEKGVTGPRITLVLTSYQGRRNLETYLPRNLETVRATAAIGEVVVADDGSTDDSVELLRERFPEVKVVALPANRGFGAAANAAFRSASHPYVLNISNDMVLEPGAAESLLAGFIRPDIFSVSARLLDPAGATEKGRTVPTFAVGDLKVWRTLAARLGESPPPGGMLQHFSGAIGLFDRRLFLELGGFDDLFLPFFVEETDLCYRAWKRGYRILYEPAARVTHHHRESGTILHQFSPRVRRVQFGKNRLLFIWKNIHDPGYVALHAANLAVRAAVSWLALDLDFYRSLAGALGRIGEVLPRRKLERERARRSDREVFREFRESVFRA